MNADEAVKEVERPQNPIEEDGGQDYLREDEKIFECEKRELIIRQQKQMLDEKHDEHELRKKFIGQTFALVVSVILVSLAITVMSGMAWITLSDAVVIALLTTTTANVIGILLIAFNWLFPKR